MSRARWIQLGAAALLVVLVGGRWLAVSTADRLWAESLGVSDTQQWITHMRLGLFTSAFVGAAVWCVGNLFLIYMSISSVSVPRRIGNLVIPEALPRRYLLVGVILAGLGLALVLSVDSGSWWYAWALASADFQVGTSDPVLQRDLSYYLLTLPWIRTLHGYVTVLAAVMLGVCIILYAAVGAIRSAKRRFVVTGWARRHLSGLMATFALALVWGYFLEPAEYVAGIHNVPYDTVLLDVRLPTAQLLSAVGLMTALASLLWMRYDRISMVLVGWGALASLSFVGHYLVPSVAAGVRVDSQLESVVLDAARPAFLEYAYGIGIEEPKAPPSIFPSGNPPDNLAQAPELSTPMVWDEFAIQIVLNESAGGETHFSFPSVGVGAYPTRQGPSVPVVLGVREINLNTTRATDTALTWDSIHLAKYSGGKGAVAIRADLVSDNGMPLFVPDLSQPDSVVTVVTDASLHDDRIFFGTTTHEFAVVDKDDVAGVLAGGLLRRLALAWKLQSSRLVTSDGVDDGDRVLWHRNATERLEQVAPFATFDSPRPVVVSGRLVWLASGYTASTGFPLTPRTQWRGIGVGYLRAGYVGTVDAASGETRVYLLPEADPLGSVWAGLAPDVVSPFRDLPQPLREHVSYPVQLLRVQRAMLRNPSTPRRAGFFGRMALSGPELQSTDPPYGWLYGANSEGAGGMRLLTTVEGGQPSQLEGLLEGSVTSEGLKLAYVGSAQLQADPGAGGMQGQFAARRGIDVGVVGPVKTFRLGDGIAGIQSAYVATDGEEPGKLLSVAVGWAGATGEAKTFDGALADLAGSDSQTSQRSQDLGLAKRLFEQLDAARRSGDWNAFGRAYEGLRRLLTEVPGGNP